MPKSTFWKLAEEKQQRIQDAICHEFLAVPFERASIKRMVEEAKIPRGSFYQYFEDKADAFEYLIGQEAALSKGMLHDASIKEIDVFQLIESVFLRELDHIERNENLTKAKLLNQVAKSPIAMDIFTNFMIASMKEEAWFVSEFMKSCSTMDSMEPVMEMAISALKGAILSVLNADQETNAIYEKLRVKLEIIRLGMENMPS
jgi:AcrR family transcriptional regulator